MTFVFDLDGTLIDNRLAIAEAYRAAGVHEVPVDVPWTEFCTKAQHDRKNEMYPFFLERFAQPTALYEALWLTWHYRPRWQTWRRPTILTGASPEAVQVIVSTPLFRHLLPEIAEVITGQTPVMKADWLATHGWGTYVDDSAQARRVIQELTTWKVIAPQEATLRPSSWPPAPTHDSKASSRRD
jgi:hypothetical protein